MLLGMLCETACVPYLFFLIDIVYTSGKLYLPQSLLRLGVRALIWTASFTPLSNRLGSVVSISVFSNSMECNNLQENFCKIPYFPLERSFHCY